MALTSTRAHRGFSPQGGGMGWPRSTPSCLAFCLSPDPGVVVWGQSDCHGSSQHHKPSFAIVLCLRLEKGYKAGAFISHLNAHPRAWGHKANKVSQQSNPDFQASLKATAHWDALSRLLSAGWYSSSLRFEETEAPLKLLPQVQLRGEPRSDQRLQTF